MRAFFVTARTAKGPEYFSWSAKSSAEAGEQVAMATAEQILGCIQFAAESARKHCPTDEKLRIDSFVCYLSGALKNYGAEGEAAADVVFALFKDAPLPPGA